MCVDLALQWKFVCELKALIYVFVDSINGVLDDCLDKMRSSFSKNAINSSSSSANNNLYSNM